METELYHRQYPAPRYFYPQDVVVKMVGGKKVASIDFSLPTLWDDASRTAAKQCYVTGWEMARRAHEYAAYEEYMKRVHPKYHAENIAAKGAYKRGMSVSEFRDAWGP